MESVPPRRYGGTERIVSYLTEELVQLGHHVTLFASADSVTAAELVGCTPTAPRLEPKMRARRRLSRSSATHGRKQRTARRSIPYFQHTGWRSWAEAYIPTTLATTKLPTGGSVLFVALLVNFIQTRIIPRAQVAKVNALTGWPFQKDACHVAGTDPADCHRHRPGGRL
jgi:hypothetical protein